MARKIIQQQNVNSFAIILLMIMILGVGFGWMVGLQAGQLYGILFTTTFATFFIVFSLVDETNKQTLRNFYKTPLYSSTPASIGMFLLGWIAIAIINFLGSLGNFFGLQNFSTTQVFGDLYFSGGGRLSEGISQTFQAGILESSKLTEFYYSCIVAPIQEEWTFAIVLPLLGYMFAIGIRQLFGKTLPFGIKDKTFLWFITIVLSIGAFMYIHKLNASYVGIMFIIAGLFRLAINVLIYFYGLALSFGIGAHMANNTTAWVNANGFGTLISTLVTSVFGWLFLGLFLWLIIYSIRNFGDVVKGISEELSNR